MSSSWNHTIHQLAAMIAARETNVERIVDSALQAITTHNPSLRAFTRVEEHAARRDARTADREIATGGHRGPLHGIPISIKDLIDISGVPTTAASRTSSSIPAKEDATVVSRLRAAGAIIIGKCNLHECAFGTTGESSSFGPTLHPLDQKRSPGGSSSGSAVSVVTGMAVASIGTDTGGSIRIPAAACGLVGLKPTFGEIPMRGVQPLAFSLDHVGPLTRCVTDARLVLHALRGPESPQEIRNTSTIAQRLGCPRPYFFEQLDDDVRTVIEQALNQLSDTGWQVRDTSIQHVHDAPAVCLPLILSEAAAIHDQRLTECPERYTEEVRLRLELGRYVRGVDYARAQRGRAVLARAVDDALADHDALVLPALAIAAPRLGTSEVHLNDEHVSLRALTLRMTQLFNATGHPAISIPCGHTPQGLPCGLQLVGARGRTDHLLDVAAACEQRLEPLLENTRDD
jgi:aspartyl-tRNA(Asn)/glutamyl-tRNA(Gln) amidotransferase subunit A